MNSYALYQDIQKRTGGEVYMSMVGPVRTGKSTFIRRMMEMLVLPRLTEQEAAELTDQLPVSGSGKTITTVEPKFIPKKGVSIPLSDEKGMDLRIRFIDCVGYMVEGAGGHMENGQERMVHTPWNEEAIPFSQAAEIGTKKVIYDHSTIGIVMTTDGSFGEIPRENYLPAEERTVNELKEIGKPFLMVLNTNRPAGKETRQLADSMAEKYGVPVLPINCDQLRQEDIDTLFRNLLDVFPISEISFFLPKWLGLLSEDSPILQEILKEIRDFTENLHRMKDVEQGMKEVAHPKMKGLRVDNCSLEDGKVTVFVEMKEECYYEILSNVIGEKIENEQQFMGVLKSLSQMKREYNKLSEAWSNVRAGGYGVVNPSFEEISLEEPELIHQGNRFGIKIRAVAPSVQMIRAEITTEIAPIVGSEEQAKDLIANMQGISKDKKDEVWDTNVFGKTMGQMVEEGIGMKIARLTEDSQRKIQESMQKIVNESNGGLVCFII